MTVNAVFMGSPALALPCLEALLAHSEVRVVGAFTQPDRPSGRRGSPQPCPVKARAEEAGVPVHTPQRLKDEAVLDVLRSWGTELIVVCAYGRILPAAVLALPRLGCFNVHYSLLPRWRGASPVQAALLSGDTYTGVCLQRMAEALDTGDIVAQSEPLPIAPDETAGSLGPRLGERAGVLLAEALPLLASGNPPLQPQDEAAATYCGIIRKEHGAVDFAAESAAAIERKHRAYDPWPGCYAYLGAQRLGLQHLQVAEPAPDGDAAPGTLHRDGRVPAEDGWVRLLQVRPEGRKTMDFAAFRNGHPAAVGQRLAPQPAAERDAAEG